jgi:hypothetical protein
MSTNTASKIPAAMLARMAHSPNVGGLILDMTPPDVIVSV